MMPRTVPALALQFVNSSAFVRCRFSADINGRYSLKACDPISGHAVYKGGKGGTLHCVSAV